MGPTRIIVISSCPQIRFPDVYGIDMAKMGDLAAFRAAIAMLRERGQELGCPNSLRFFQETIKKTPKSRGSRSCQSSVTPLEGYESSKTLVLLCFGASREGRMIRDRSLLTS